MISFARNIIVSSPLLKNNEDVVITYECDDDKGKKPYNVNISFDENYLEFEDFELFDEFVSWVSIMRSRIQDKHCKHKEI